MVDSVNIQPQTAVKDNTKRNTAIATGIGLVGGGTAGYLTKQIYKDEKFTDEFIKNATHKFIDEFSEDKAIAKLVKDVVNLPEDASIETIKKFVKKHAKAIGVDSKEDLDKALKTLEEDANNIMDNSTKQVLKTAKEKYNELLGNTKEVLESYYEPKTKKFNFGEDQAGKTLEKIFNNAKRSVKSKAAAIWGISSAAVLGIGTYIISKASGHKDA